MKKEKIQGSKRGRLVVGRMGSCREALSRVVLLWPNVGPSWTQPEKARAIYKYPKHHGGSPSPGTCPRVGY